jgi:mono/diheme cytochrome c family protein
MPIGWVRGAEAEVRLVHTRAAGRDAGRIASFRRLARGRKEVRMTIRRVEGLVVAVAAAAVLTGGVRLAAQAQAPPQVPQVKLQEARGFVGIEGKETFDAYCAVCHGADGRGNGPAAPALKLPVPDLTTMTARHGKFDALGIERTITGADKMPVAHGTVAMPIWGPIFVATGDRSTAMLRAKNVVDYLKSLQAKSSR